MALALTQPRAISLLGWLRVTLRLVAMLTWLMISVAAFYLLKPLTRRNPVPRLFLGGIAWLAGVALRYRGAKVQRGAFFISNHVSWIDIPALAWATGTAFVGHDGLAEMPLLRWLCRMNDTVFIARHDRGSVADQVAQVREALAETGALAIFPEGTTSDGTTLLPFKSSLLSALEPLPSGIAVQPVLLDFGPEAHRVAWIGEESGLDNFLKILSRGRPLNLTVHFLPVLSGAELTNRKTIAAAARDAIGRERASA